MKGKTVLITGASSGIGFQAAKLIAQKGATVFVVARNESKAQKTVAELQQIVPDATIKGLHADLSSLEAVRKLAADFKTQSDQLDVLLNNAGLVVNEHQLSADGYELQFAVNHLAPFLLTHLLIDLIKAAPQGRVVNVSSAAHFQGKLSLQRAKGPQESYKGMAAYAQSKLCNVLFTRRLAKAMEGTKVTTNCLHPGVVKTQIGNRPDSILSTIWTIMKPFMRSEEAGAGTSVFLATDPSLETVTGKYFDQNQKEKTASEIALDDTVAEELWMYSMDAVGLASA
ncbi:MAG: SDR family oxidoreductase [Bacteroidota bacterium]